MSDSPPVVLVHGFAGSTQRTWAEVGWLDLLADMGREVVGIDLLGHGTAPKPHDPEAYTELEQQVSGALPAGPVDAIGFSLGARVLLTLAAADPSRFRRIVVAGVGANLFADDHSDALADILDSDDPSEVPHSARYFLAHANEGDSDRHALAACLRRPSRGPLDPGTLVAIDLPVLVVLGDADFAGPADSLMAALPNARLVVLPGIDHFATPKQFAFIDETLEFLGE